jgi:hypothetical protein
MQRAITGARNQQSSKIDAQNTQVSDLQQQQAPPPAYRSLLHLHRYLNRLLHQRHLPV